MYLLLLFLFLGVAHAQVYSPNTPAATTQIPSGTLSPSQQAILEASLAAQQATDLANANLLSNQSVTIANSFTIPKVAQIVQTQVVCNGCSAYISTPVSVPRTAMSLFGATPRMHTASKAGAKKSKDAKAYEQHQRVLERRARKAQRTQAFTTSEANDDVHVMHSQYEHCLNGVCQKAKYKIEKKMVAIKRKQEDLDRLLAQRQKAIERGSKALQHNRHLLQFDPLGDAAFAIAVEDLHLILNLQSAFETFQTAINQDIADINYDINLINEQLAQIENALQQISQNVYLQNGVTALNTASTAIRLYALDMKFEHMPGLLALQAAELAATQGLTVPVYFGGPLYTINYQLQNAYTYYGLIDDTNPAIPVLNFLPVCEFGVYMIAHIQEATMPWGYSVFQAVVYAVYPNAPSMLNSAYQNCDYAGQTGSTNGVCFLSQSCTAGENPPQCDPNAQERARRVAFAEIYFEGYANTYSRLFPLAVYNDKQALLNAYTFEQFGFTGPLAAGLASRPPQASCAAGFESGTADLPGTLIQFPYNPVVNATNNQCLDINQWSAFYTTSGCTAHTGVIVELSATAPIFPMNITNPTFLPFPAYSGDIEYGFNGTITYRTIGLTPNENITVNYLVQLQTFYFNSSEGISRSPPFFPEYRTTDGRSVSEQLIAQYQAIGLTLPYVYNPVNGSQNQNPFSYIPTTLLTLSQEPGNPTCYSSACLLNTANYYWDTTTNTYGAPVYTELIAPVGTPINCYPSYDCSTVGENAQNSGVTPASCPASATTCCNSLGYVCFVQFNGTVTVGATLFELINASIPNFNTFLEQLAAAPPEIDYSQVILSVQEYQNLSASLLQIPQINVPIDGNPFGGLVPFLTGVASAAEGAAGALAGVVGATLNSFSGLFTGLFGGLSAFLAYLPIILFVLIGFCLCFVLVQNPSLLKIGQKGGSHDECCERKNLLPAAGSMHPNIRTRR